MIKVKDGDPVRFMDGEIPSSGTVLIVLSYLVWVRDMFGNERLLDRQRIVFDHVRRILLESGDQPKREEPAEDTQDQLERKS